MNLTEWGTFKPTGRPLKKWLQSLRDHTQRIGAYRTMLESLADIYAESDELFNYWVDGYVGCALNIDAAWSEYYEEIKEQLNSYDTLVSIELTQEVFDETIEEWEDALGSLLDSQVVDLIWELNEDFNLKLK